LILETSGFHTTRQWRKIFFLPSAVVVGENADARGTEAVKLSVKLLSGLVFLALVTVAVIGLSNSASAAVDGKVYVTNVASTLTNEASPPTGRKNASTVYGTYKSDTVSGTTARDIVTDSDKFIVTIIDSDLNQTLTISAANAGIGYATGTISAGEVDNVFGSAGGGSLLNLPGDSIRITLSDTALNPIVGAIGTISILDTGTKTAVVGVRISSFFAGGGTLATPPWVVLEVTSGTGPTGRVDIQYATSAVDTITAQIKSVVDSIGSVVSLVETGRDTGRFDGYVRVKERTSAFTVGVNGGTTGSPATIPAIGGPITITYADALTSGSATKLARVTTLTIDVTPPTATISAPVTASEGQSRLPTFTGNVTDNQSGLDVSAFALFVHETADAANTVLVINSSNTATPPAAAAGATAAGIDVSAMSDGVATLAFNHTSTTILPTGISGAPDHIVDFQIQAVDLAGNYGYSDSNSALGNIQTSGRHGNQPHTIKIDQVNPLITSADSGIGLDTSVTPSVDKANVRDTIKVTFDGKIKDSSVSPTDFQVVFSGVGGATVVPASVIVKGAVIYLDLDTTIPSDNKPTVKLLGTVQDLAGNSASDGTKAAADKLAPVITVTRSTGSGTGTSAEAADSLTKSNMTVTITSDEALQGSPAITVTDISVTTPSVGNVLSGSPTLLSGTNTWNLIVAKGGSASGSRAIKVVATDSAGNVATKGDDTTKAYVLDTLVSAPTSTPANAGKTTQSNPFLTTDYKSGGEASSVTITSATLQEAALTAVDVTANVIPSADGKTFFFQPTAALSNVKYTYVVKAVDAAANTLTTTTTFTKSDRTDFVIELFAGWNVVSVPSDPLVTDIGSVLSNAGIKQVVGFDATTPSQPWRIASKVGTGAYSSQTTPSLTNIVAGPGYWIETTDFEDQKITLEGEAGPGTVQAPGLTTIATGAGWNLVGVVDQSRKQTQKVNKNATLTRPNEDGTSNAAVTVATYFNTVNNGRAYVFNTVQSQFNELGSTDSVTIGSGIWVFVSAQTSGDFPPIVP